MNLKDLHPDSSKEVPIKWEIFLFFAVFFVLQKKRELKYKTDVRIPLALNIEWMG